MNSGVIAAALSFGLTTAAASQWASHTQLVQGNSGAAGISVQGIGLTASHKQIIYDKIIGERSQSLPGDQQLAVGQTIPDSVMLNTMPIEAKDQVGLLKDYKYVKLRDDKILIVDPATREIMDIIAKEGSGR